MDDHPGKVRSIVDIPIPTSQSELLRRGFLATASFYRRWIASCAKTTEPLNNLLKTDVKNFQAEWDKDSETYQKCIDSLKVALVTYIPH
eukprot:SAG11_NODE_1284_length_5305_cov_1.528621_1_plen_89_part_00